MIKILFFITTLTGGGAEKVLRNLVNNMDRTKFDITVFTVEKEDSSKLLNTGIKYKYLNKSKTKLGNKLFHLCFRLLTALNLTYPLFIKDNYDIEVAYLEFGPTKVIAGSTNKNAKKISWVHCDPTKNPSFLSNIKELSKQYRKYDSIVCVSGGVETGFNSLFGMQDKTIVLTNVIDEDELYKKQNEYVPKLDADRKNLLAVGRLSKEKCFDKLINTIAGLSADGIDVNLNILGDGPEKAMLEKLIADLSLFDKVHLLGFADNPYPYISKSDIIVCSSRFEGFSTVITEAILLGKVVVTTPCAGMSELLGDSEYGLIADDSEYGFYNALKTILTDEELFKHYQSKAEQRKNDLRKSRVIEQTENYFNNILTD